jgi:hypothetical protein
MRIRAVCLTTRLISSLQLLDNTTVRISMNGELARLTTEIGHKIRTNTSGTKNQIKGLLKTGTSYYLFSGA